jgi:PIF1-like helicase
LAHTGHGDSVFQRRRKDVIVRAWPRAKTIPARNDSQFEHWAFAQLRLYKPFRTIDELSVPSVEAVFSAHLATGGFPHLVDQEQLPIDAEAENRVESDRDEVMNLFDPPVMDNRFVQDDYQLLMNLTRHTHDSLPLLGGREIDVIHRWPSSWHGWQFDNLVSWLLETKECTQITPLAVAPLHAFSLSPKQRLAFDIVQDHCFGNFYDDQLLMIVIGTAGTGKSFLIDSIRSLFADRNASQSLKITAPTGIAAANISGSTIFSLLSIQTPSLTGTRLLSLQLLMKDVRLLIIDEYSFLSITVIDTLDRHLRSIYPHSPRPFGGLHIMLCGDPAQLPPVLAQPLYAHRGHTAHIAQRFYFFKTVVELDVPFRQIGSDGTQVCLLIV